MPSNSLLGFQAPPSQSFRMEVSLRLHSSFGGEGRRVVGGGGGRRQERYRSLWPSPMPGAYLVLSNICRVNE